MGAGGPGLVVRPANRLAGAFPAPGGGAGVWAPGCAHRLRRWTGVNGATGDRLDLGWTRAARDWLYDPQIDLRERFPPRAVAPGCGRQDAPTGCDAGPGSTAPPVTGSTWGGPGRPGTGCTTRKSTLDKAYMKNTPHVPLRQIAEE